MPASGKTGEVQSLTTAVSDSVTVSPCHRVTVSAPRAWLALVALGLRRQARMRQMVWIALGLLALVVGIVAFSTATNGWSTANRRAFLHATDRPRLPFGAPRPDDHPVLTTHGQVVRSLTAIGTAVPLPPAEAA